MADTSNLSNYLQDLADAIREKKGTEAQIPAANFDTEILSIETGTDTSDATATASDIVSGKTAYADGEKLTGTLKDYRNSEDVLKVNYQVSVDTTEPEPGTGTPTLNINGSPLLNGVVGMGAHIQAVANYNTVATAIGLTSDKIVSGNTILGVEGTAEVSEPSVFTFQSEEEANRKTDYKNNDLAFIMNSQLQALTSTNWKTIDNIYWTLSENVYLSEAIELQEAIEVQFVFQNYIGFQLDVDSSSIFLKIAKSNTSFNTATWTSTDGHNYTLTSTDGLTNGVCFTGLSSLWTKLQDLLNSNPNVLKVLSQCAKVYDGDILQNILVATPSNETDNLDLYCHDLTSLRLNEYGIIMDIKCRKEPIHISDYMDIIKKISSGADKWYGVLDTGDIVYMVECTKSTTSSPLKLVYDKELSAYHVAFWDYESITKYYTYSKSSKQLTEHNISSLPVVNGNRVGDEVPNTSIGFSILSASSGVLDNSCEMENCEIRIYENLSGASLDSTGLSFTLLRGPIKLVKQTWCTAQNTDVLQNTTFIGSNGYSFGTNVPDVGVISDEEYQECVNLSNQILGTDISL